MVWVSICANLMVHGSALGCITSTLHNRRVDPRHHAFETVFAVAGAVIEVQREPGAEPKRALLLPTHRC